MSSSTPTSGKDELTTFLDTLKIHNKDLEMCFNDAVAVSHLKQLIAASNQQAVQTALEAIGEPPFGDFNIKPESYDDVIKAIRWYKSAIQAVQTALAEKQKELELKFVEFDPDVVKLISENLHDLF